MIGYLSQLNFVLQGKRPSLLMRCQGSSMTSMTLAEKAKTIGCLEIPKVRFDSKSCLEGFFFLPKIFLGQQLAVNCERFGSRIHFKTRLSRDVIGYEDSKCHWCDSIGLLSQLNSRLLLVKFSFVQLLSCI